MWDMKLRATNEQTGITKTHTQITVWLSEGRGVGGSSGKGGQIYDDGRSFDFGWWACNATSRSCIIQLYTL